MSRCLRPLLPAWLLWPLALLYLGSLARLVQLHAWPKSELAEQALARAHRLQTVDAPRGRILDRGGMVLAESRPRWRLVMDQPPAFRRYTLPGAESSREEASRDLAPVAAASGVGLEKLLEALFDRSRTYSVLAEGLSHGAALRLQSLVEALDNCGLRVERSWQRLYPQGRALAHLVGYTQRDARGEHQGATGLERMCEPWLLGRDGVQSRLALGRNYGIDPALDAVRARPAPDLRTTLDARVGAVLREELSQVVEKHDPDWCLGVVLEVDSGAILALGALPDFDPNRPGDVPYQDGTPVGLGFPGIWPFEPGSTCKPLLISRALALGELSDHELFDQEGGAWDMGGRVLRNARGVPQEPLHWREVLAYSSNIGAAKIGMRMGAPRLKQALEDFGLWEPMGLPWKEPRCLRPDEREWRRTIWTVPSVSIGRQLEVTAVRLAAAHAAVVNGGLLHQPHVLFDAARPEPRRVIPEPVSDRVRDALVDVVEEPSRTWLHDDELRWGGKSGTVEKKHEVGYTSLFVGFAPADAPEILALLVVDQPKGKHYYGSQVAGPAVGSLLKRTLELRKAPSEPSPLDGAILAAIVPGK